MTAGSSIFFKNVVSSFAALFVAVLISTGIILAVGKDPLLVYGMFFRDTLGTSYGIGQVLFKATPLMFTGLAAAICFKAGLFNIGAEGQLMVGAFCTALAGALLPPLPPFIVVTASILAGFAGGAFWGLLPGLLRSLFGAHEVITTIMLNFIAAGVVNYLVSNVFFVPATVHTPPILPGAELARLDSFVPAFRGSPVNGSLIFAVLLCGFVAYFLKNTTAGYELRAVGQNPEAARFAGISVRKTIIMSFILSGGVAGFVGSNYVLGYKHYFELGFSEGIGFIGIAVALLARNHPIAIIFTSLFFGIIEYGSLTINTIVPKELANILQAVVILSMVVFLKLFDRYFERRGA